MPGADRHQALADIAAGGDAHAEPVAGILPDEAPIGAQQEAALGLAQLEEILRTAVAPPVEDRAAGRRELVDRSPSSVDLPEPDLPTTASTSPS